jgi:hypothetical protein
MRLGLPIGQGEGSGGSPMASVDGGAKMGWHGDDFGQWGSSSGGW